MGAGLVSWLPGLALLPIIAGLSYYFVLENAPTPVVRERGGEAVIVRHLESGDTMWRNVEYWRDGFRLLYFSSMDLNGFSLTIEALRK